MSTNSPTLTPAAADFASAWEQWQQSRWSAVSAPHGVSALDETAWLFDEPQDVAGVAGVWHSEGGVVVGTGLAESGYRDAAGELIADTVRLQPGQTIAAGDRLLRAFDRDGSPALRVLDPASPNRTSVTGIDAYPPEEKWRVEAQYSPNSEPLEVELVDGYRTINARTGTLTFILDAVERTLTATEGPGGLSIVFGDATNGVDTYRFRFLGAAFPDAEGRTIVDFTRAFLPPCAFSPHYVCPLPPPGNRFDIPITAGEKTAIVR